MIPYRIHTTLFVYVCIVVLMTDFFVPKKALAQGTTTPIVVTGDAVIGFTGHTFQDFFYSVINNSGQVAFSGSSAQGLSTLWLSDANGLSLVAYEGGQAPGTPLGTQFDGSFAPLLNDTGQVGFNAILKRGTGDADLSNHRGVWVADANGAQLVIRTGGEVPDTPSSVFSGSQGERTFNDVGQIAIAVDVENQAGNLRQEGVWAGSAGSVVRVAFENEEAPGVAPGLFGSPVRDFTFISPVINDSGQLAFKARLDETSAQVDISNNEGVWMGQAGNLTLVARAGDRAPGTPNGQRKVRDKASANRPCQNHLTVSQSPVDQTCHQAVGGNRSEAECRACLQLIDHLQ